jgi:y4mF family transcriptional regulator
MVDTMSSSSIPYGKITTPDALGLMIRAQRKASGVSQADAAALCGVGVRFLSELERGKSTIELGKALQVLNRLGLELWLMPRGTKGPPR